MSESAKEIIDLYKRHANTWAKRRGETLQEHGWLDKFLALQPMRPKILDLGCGSGQPIGQYLVEKGCNVTGVDASEEMIAMARENCPNSTHIVEDMRQIDLGQTFDGIIAWNSFFHLTPIDQRNMFPIFRRHAVPGAALMFTAGPGHGEAIGELQGEPLYHASLDREEYRELLDQKGFELIENVIEDPECGLHSIWLAKLRDK